MAFYLELLTDLFPSNLIELRTAPPIERAEALETLKQVMEECVLVLKAMYESDRPERRTVIAHIEMNIDHEHGWLGGKYDDTLSDLIERLEDEANEIDDESESVSD
jgi:hypothetical protein